MNATARIMMIRSAVHTLVTGAGLWVCFHVLADANMMVRMALYAFVWLICGSAYFVLLYCKQYALDLIDDRIRRIVHDQSTAEDMRRYRRRLSFIIRWRKERDTTRK